MMQRICLFTVLLFTFSISGNAQGTSGTLRCSLRGGLEIHASRDPGSSMIGRVQCGDPVLIIDQRFGSPHIRTEDGKDGYIISQNFGQWSFEAASSTTATAAITVASAPPINITVPKQPQRPELRPTDESFRRFDIGFVAVSYNRQGSLNMYGGNLSFMTHINENIGIVADVAVHESLEDPVDLFVSGTTSKGRVVAYRFGPRLYALTDRRASIFTEFLVGGTRVTGIGTASSVFIGVPLRAELSFNGFSSAIGGGVDFKITPWLTWRTQADYSYLRFSGANSYGVRTGTGVAFRFGH
jgi:hypothetical protein